MGPDAEAAAAAAAGLPPGAAPGAGAGVGHQEIPDEILLEQGQAQDLPVYYGGVVGEWRMDGGVRLGAGAVGGVGWGKARAMRGLGRVWHCSGGPLQ